MGVVRHILMVVFPQVVHLPQFVVNMLRIPPEIQELTDTKKLE